MDLAWSRHYKNGARSDPTNDDPLFVVIKTCYRLENAPKVGAQRKGFIMDFFTAWSAIIDGASISILVGPFAFVASAMFVVVLSLLDLAPEVEPLLSVDLDYEEEETPSFVVKFERLSAWLPLLKQRKGLNTECALTYFRVRREVEQLRRVMVYAGLAQQS